MREEQQSGLSRRQFIKRAGVVALALPALPLGFAALRDSEATKRAATNTTLAAPAQDWAGAADGPMNPSWKTMMIGENEPGKPMLISGTIFQPDGVTPASGILLYVYHTDAQGYYSKEAATGR